MKFVEVNKEQWVENCVTCHVAMRPVNAEGEVIFAVIESFPIDVLTSERAQASFQTWTENPILQPSPTYWYCESCNTLWGTVFGWWTKSTWKGEITPLPPTYISQTGVERVIDYTPPFKNASMCPHCHTWRHIINTEVRGIGESQEITHTHYCIECRSVEDITVASKEKLSNQFINENMSLEGLIGERNPIKLSQ